MIDLRKEEAMMDVMYQPGGPRERERETEREQDEGLLDASTS